MNYRPKLLMLQSLVSKMYIAAMLLQNVRAFLYGNQISKYFDIILPTLSEYLFFVG